MKRIITGIVLLATLICVGCGETGYFYWLLAPRETVEVPSAFEQESGHSLQGKTVAIVIADNEAISLEYPAVYRTLGLQMMDQLKKNVDDVRVIHPDAVMRYKRENAYWESMEKYQLAKALKSDYVLYVTLLEYSTRLPGTADAFQGRISAEVQVFSADPEESGDDDPVWQTEDPIEQVYPQKVSYSKRAERYIRTKTEAEFADLFAKHFYTFETEKYHDEMEPGYDKEDAELKRKSL